MNMTNADFHAIEKAMYLLPRGEDFMALTKEEQDIITKADTVMMNLLRKKDANNAKTAKYIAEKRKLDKNYARSKKEEEE